MTYDLGFNMGESYNTENNKTHQKSYTEILLAYIKSQLSNKILLKTLL